MTRKSGLGKGLGALIPNDYVDDAEAGGPTGSIEIPIAAVTPNRRQPRSHFDEESLAGLTASIAELGVLQPILVRAIDDGGYELIAGERRWRAAKRAGLQNVPAVVRSAESDGDLLEQALVENLHRDDLNPMEEAGAYQQLIEDFGLTQDAVAARVGKSRAAVSNTLRLFKLPAAIQSMVADGQLSAGHVRALLATPDRSMQTELAQRIVRERLSVREIEDLLRDDPEPATDDAPADEPTEPPTTKRRAPRPLPEPGYLELEELLAEHLQTRVSISAGAGSGKLVVQFADLADLERIYKAMVGAGD